MEELPPAVLHVEVPEFFSPSELGTWGGCALKLVVGSLPRGEWTHRLGSGPAAAIGTLVHRVLELAAKGCESTAEDLFDNEQARMLVELRNDPRRAHFADLSSTKTLAEWSRLRSWVSGRSRLLGVLRRRSVGTSVLEQAPFRAKTGAEVALASKKLRLRGRADRIRTVGPRRFEIRDFKSGSAVAPDGGIKDEIALQLRAYGLLLLELDPEAVVLLLVDDGLEREVGFALEERRVAAETIEQIVQTLPLPGPAETASLASPGAGCRGCSVRHVCPGYRNTAPSWWKEYPATLAAAPWDIWGEIVEVRSDGDIVLRDEAGRRVRVDRIDSRHGLGAWAVGRRICFFGLEATGPTRGFDGKRFHPRSFHELPRDGGERRAWSLRVLTSQET